MFLNFDKESMFFINDGEIKDINYFTSEDAKKLIKQKQLSQFFSELQFLVYYIDPSQCNNIVYLDANFSHQKLIKKLFPSINFYFNYEIDLNYLQENDQTYAIISNSNYEDMQFQKNIIVKYQPYAALLDFVFSETYEMEKYTYLDGLLLKNLFDISLSAKLLVRGIGYRDWNMLNITRRLTDFQKSKITNNYFNPISNDTVNIFKERGFYNTFDETAVIIIIMDYLKKINQNVNFNNIIKLLIFILDNLIEGKSINLDIIYLEGN